MKRIKTCYLSCSALNLIYEFKDFPHSVHQRTLIDYLRGSLNNQDFLKSKELLFFSNKSDLDRKFEKLGFHIDDFRIVTVEHSEFLRLKKSKADNLKKEGLITFLATKIDNPQLEKDFAIDFVFANHKMKKSDLRTSFKHIFEFCDLETDLKCPYEELKFTIIKSKKKLLPGSHLFGFDCIALHYPGWMLKDFLDEGFSF